MWRPERGTSCILLYHSLHSFSLETCLSLSLELLLGWLASGSSDFPGFLLPWPAPRLNPEPHVCTASSTYPRIQLFILLIQYLKFSYKATQVNKWEYELSVKLHQGMFLPWRAPSFRNSFFFLNKSAFSLLKKKIHREKQFCLWIQTVVSSGTVIGGSDYLLCAVECQPLLRILAASHSCHIGVTTQLGAHWPWASAQPCPSFTGFPARAVLPGTECFLGSCGHLGMALYMLSSLSFSEKAAEGHGQAVWATTALLQLCPWEQLGQEWLLL